MKDVSLFLVATVLAGIPVGLWLRRRRVMHKIMVWLGARPPLDLRIRVEVCDPKGRRLAYVKLPGRVWPGDEVLLTVPEGPEDLRALERAGKRGRNPITL